ncbi:Ig-like domain-containing protein [Microvirga sp. HBU67558]|uniref:Ig-like domain-containing protein n=1 Tax=Microvirga TaxID=186650 RepID=UPI001B377E25|nr:MULTISPECIES: Ig-like domain-containing protein [unclassified Microvirga]MBQ0820841.1 Ig-like domain-containing protein [Microvirga sp. HBU67558]
MANGTLNFSSNDPAHWSDGVAEDGEGGAINLFGANIQIGLLANPYGTSLGVPIEWYDSANLATGTGFTGLTTFYYPGYGTETDPGWAGFVIKSANGSEFQIDQFRWYDWGGWTGEIVNVVGYKDGQQVASSSFTSNDDDFIVTFTFDASFDRVDEVRITYADGGGWAAINNIQLTVPPAVIAVTSPSANRSYQAGEVITISVEFDSAVNVASGIPTLLLETGMVDRYAVYTGGSGTSTLTFAYTVQAGDGSADLDYAGTAALTLNGATIKAVADGLDASVALPTPGSLASLGANKAIVIDAVAPTLAITSSKSTLHSGESATITFTFSEDPGSSFTAADVAVSGGTLGPISGSGVTRTATFTPSLGTDNGTARITVAAGSYADAAGNAGGAGVTPAITFDTRVPDAPSAPELSAASDSGSSFTDSITSVTLPTFRGSAEPGATVKVYDGGTLIATTSAAGNGSWSAASNVALPEGVHTITVTATDAAGNVSTASGPLNMTVDFTPPSPPATLDLATASDNGSSNSDNVTGVTRPTFTGTAEAGATIILYDGLEEIGRATATNGTWSIALDTPLTQGNHSITARATDLAGNTSAASTALTVQIITAGPATAVSSMALSSDSGLGGDFITNVSSQVISGTLSSLLAVGERVQVSLDGGESWQDAISTAGSAVWSHIASLTEGTHEIWVRVIDAVDNSGPIRDQVYTLDTVAPGVTITSDVSQLKAGETATITFTFSQDPGSSFSWDGSAGSLAVSGGTLSAISGTGLTRTAVFTPSANVDGGSASITVAAGSYHDAAGNAGTAGTTPPLGYDTVAPGAPSAPVLASGSDSGHSSSDNLTNHPALILTGSGETGTVIRLYDSDGITVIGTGTVTGGVWSITTSPLSAGRHALTARAVDAAGNLSAVSAGLAVTIDDTAPTLVHSDPADDAAQVGVSDDLVLTFSEAIVIGAGTIELHARSGALVESFDVATSSRISMAGNRLTIDPTGPLESGAGYYLTLSAGALRDASGNDFAGIADAATFNFTTIGTVEKDPVVTPNTGGGVDIAITDPFQLTAALGTGGVDHVFYAGSGTVVLPDNIENITLRGSASVMGNGLDNDMRSGAGENVLRGKDGNDTLHGYHGSDSIYGGSGHDTMSGGSSQDWVSGGSGNDTVNGGSGHDRVYGDSGRDTVYGGTGNDTVSGGAGNDTLYGNAGRDVFVFDTRLNRSSNVDTIKDFNVANDSLWLDNAVFTKLGSGTLTKPGALSSGFFVVGSRALDGDDYLIYDRATGVLSYDADGSGATAAVVFARLGKGLALTHKDFFVV